MSAIKIGFIILLPSLLFCEKIYKDPKLHAKTESKKIKCRLVCDKKLHRKQEIAEAISFYERSKYYKFEAKKF